MNPLDKLTIKGFKSIRELSDFKLNNLNIFIGGNGAGKSNLISFFKMLRELINGNLKNFVNDSGGMGDLFYNGRKITKEIFFQSYFGDRGYRFSLKSTPKDLPYIVSEARYYEHGSFDWWPLGDSGNEDSLLVREALGISEESKYSKPVYDAVSSWEIYHFHDTSETAAMRYAEIIQDNKILHKDASNIAPYLYKLKNEYSDVYSEIVNTIKMVMPYFDNFILEPEMRGQKESINLSWNQKGSNYPLQPYHFSDGTIRFICLTTALLQPEPPSAIIIDEPELGLHPAAISLLSELIKDASNRTQIIIATQSPTLIDHFSIEDIVVVNRKESSSVFERMEKKDFKHWLEEYSLGELWTKNIISGGLNYE